MKQKKLHHFYLDSQIRDKNENEATKPLALLIHQFQFYTDHADFAKKSQKKWAFEASYSDTPSAFKDSIKSWTAPKRRNTIFSSSNESVLPRRAQKLIHENQHHICLLFLFLEWVHPFAFSYFLFAFSTSHSNKIC